MVARLAVLAMLVALGGCAHKLPTDQATAFRTLASGDRDAFANLAKSENEAVTAFVTNQVSAGQGSVSTANCDLQPAPDASGRPCAVVWKTIQLRPTAPHTRKLISAVSDYGEQMATLAEAKDIQEAQGSVSALGKAVNGLFTAAGVPPIGGALMDALVKIQQSRLVEQRRLMLLEAAQQADPGVRAAAATMTRISERLQANLQVTAVDRLTSAEGVLKTPVAGEGASAAQARRTKALGDMVKAANDLQTARDLDTDFSPLADAHAKLVEALRNPEGDTASALADIRAYLGLLKAAAVAAKDEP